MENDHPIEVIAADVMTGTILDEDFEWFIGKPGQKKWTRLFKNEEAAIAFCEGQIQVHPDVEFWLCVEINGKDCHRIVHPKWKR